MPEQNNPTKDTEQQLINRGVFQYGEKTDAHIYGPPMDMCATTAKEWVEVAMAAMDQAGLCKDAYTPLKIRLCSLLGIPYE